ncbi:uncharacterized protein BDV17DRAFT_58309 [Aspergillus undulatus]|uniref:uncharacterized protein n=1 Tax=Aspergillus undulatus TaxID=1810928 RepID=UPI003CCCA72F
MFRGTEKRTWTKGKKESTVRRSVSDLAEWARRNDKTKQGRWSRGERKLRTRHGHYHYHEERQQDSDVSSESKTNQARWRSSGYGWWCTAGGPEGAYKCGWPQQYHYVPPVVLTPPPRPAPAVSSQ